MAVRFREDGEAEGSRKVNLETHEIQAAGDPGVDPGLGKAATEGNSG